MPSIDLSITEVFESQKQGVNLVSQILEEAFLIANAAKESGQPWRYLTMLRTLEPVKNCEEFQEEIPFAASKGDGNMNEDMDQVESIVATSTPQKNADEGTKPKPDSIIGQGDEDLEVTRQEGLTKSTSMFINQLFDMSDLERAIICDDEETVQQNVAGSEVLSNAMMKIMNSYVNAAINIAFEQDPQLTQVIDIDNENAVLEEARDAEQSCLSFLTEALGGNFGKEMKFYGNDIDADNPSSDDERVIEILNEDDSTTEPPEIVVEEIIDEQAGRRDVIIIEELAIDIQNSNVNQIIPEEIAILLEGQSEENIVVIEEDDIDNDLDKNDVQQYGDMYSTLNRDYEPLCSEEDEPVLRDPKEMLMQEVELMTTHSSAESISSQPLVKEEEIKELAATSNVSALSGKSKSSIVSRWKSQGARLLSCFRGWWRRKTPGKRKEGVHYGHGSIRGMCPLSPDTRRRAASLLDQRDLYSPRAHHSVVWKFNTVNETVVNSSRYKDYTFDKPDESGEYLRD